MLSFQLQNPVMKLHPESSVAAICNRQNISKLSGVKSVSTAISSEHNIQKSQGSREEKQNIMQPRKKSTKQTSNWIKGCLRQQKFFAIDCEKVIR